MTNHPRVRYLFQAVNLLVFMMIIAFFASGLTVRQLEAGTAVVTLAFGHAGNPIHACHKRSEEELNALAPTMRAPLICPRERSVIEVELYMDDKLIHAVTAPPPGLFSDQGVDVYEKIVVPIGQHTFRVQMKDNVLEEGYTHSGNYTADLKAAQLLFIGFRQQNGFIFK